MPLEVKTLNPQHGYPICTISEQCPLCLHMPIRKTASPRDCLFRSDSVVFGQRVSHHTLFSVQHTNFFQCHLAHRLCLLTPAWIKGKNQTLGIRFTQLNSFTFFFHAIVCGSRQSHAALCWQTTSRLFVLSGGMWGQQERENRNWKRLRATVMSVKAMKDRQREGAEAYGRRREKLEERRKRGEAGRWGGVEMERKAHGWSCEGSKREETEKAERMGSGIKRDGMDGRMGTMRQIGPSPGYGQLE